ncbi:O-antigen polymerase [Propionivibrio sp.]|uniref:O-antigen polymerase n=1 Tax=Propionivibrio sp. TaxID=2212460 RepID=UPI00262BC733|nr:O-antigen polymerase [Propionivibrio sp.]
MIYQAWLLLDSLFWMGIAYYFSKRYRDALAWPVLFSLIFIPSYPLKALISEYGFFVMDVSVIDIEWKYLSFFIYNISGLAVIFPFIIFARNRVNKNVRTSTTFQKDIKLITRSYLFWIALLLILSSYGADAIYSIGYNELMQDRIESRVYERMGSGLYALLRDASLVTISLFFIVNTSGNDLFIKRLALFVYAILFSLLSFMLSGSKYQGILPLAALALISNINLMPVSKGLKSFRAVIILGILSGFIVMLAGYLRGFGGIEDLYGVGKIVLAFQQLSNSFDMPDNLAIILSRIDSIWYGDHFLYITFQYLAGWFPRFLWEDKPEIMGNLYIMQYYMEERFNGGVGEVISPSMPGEMIASGGIFFMILWSFFIGCVMRLVHFKAIVQRTPVSTIVYIWCCLNAFNLLRSGTGILGSLFIFTTIALIVTGFISVVAKGIFNNFGSSPLGKN